MKFKVVFCKLQNVCRLSSLQVRHFRCLSANWSSSIQQVCESKILSPWGCSLCHIHGLSLRWYFLLAHVTFKVSSMRCGLWTLGFGSFVPSSSFVVCSFSIFHGNDAWCLFVVSPLLLPLVFGFNPSSHPYRNRRLYWYQISFWCLSSANQNYSFSFFHENLTYKLSCWMSLPHVDRWHRMNDEWISIYEHRMNQSNHSKQNHFRAYTLELKRCLRIIDTL